MRAEEPWCCQYVCECTNIIIYHKCVCVNHSWSYCSKRAKSYYLRNNSYVLFDMMLYLYWFDQKLIDKASIPSWLEVYYVVFISSLLFSCVIFECRGCCFIYKTDMAWNVVENLCVGCTVNNMDRSYYHYHIYENCVCKRERGV